MLETVGLLGERHSYRLDQHAGTIASLGLRGYRSDELRQAPDESLAVKVGEDPRGELLVTTAVVVLADRVLAAITEPDVLAAHRVGQRVILDVPEAAKLHYGRGWLRTLRAADAVLTDCDAGARRLRMISPKIKIVSVPAFIDAASLGLRRTWSRLLSADRVSRLPA